MCMYVSVNHTWLMGDTIPSTTPFDREGQYYQL